MHPSFGDSKHNETHCISYTLYNVLQHITILLSEMVKALGQGLGQDFGFQRGSHYVKSICYMDLGLDCYIVLV